LVFAIKNNFTQLSRLLNSLASKDAFIHEFCAERDRIGIVDGQNSNRGAADSSSADEDRAVPLKMAIPALESWMKEGHKFACVQINPGDVQTLVFVAMQATPGDVLQHGSPTVLLGDDVIELKRQRIGFVWQTAIVTAVTSQLADVINQLPLHGSTAR